MNRLVTTLLVGAIASSCDESSLASDDAGPQRFNDAGQPCVTFPTEIELGEAEIGSEKVVSRRIVNRTDRTAVVRFSRIDPPFSSTANDVQGVFFLGPQSAEFVDFRFKPTDGRLHVATFTFRGGDGCEEQIVSLSGLGAGGLEVLPELRFTPIPDGQSSTLPLRVSNTRREPLQVNTVAPTDPHFTTGAGLFIPAGGTAELGVTFNAFGEGVFTAQLMLVSDRSDIATVQLVAMGGVPRIEIDRARLDINPLPQMAPTTRVLPLRNAGQGKLEVSRATVTGSSPANADVRFMTTQLGFVTLQLLPSEVGHHEWVLHVVSNDPQMPVLDVPISAEVIDVAGCTGTIVAPNLVDVMPPYPAIANVDFFNPTYAPCVVEALGFTTFTTWTHDLLSNDAFVVPAQSTVTRSFDIDAPGVALLTFSTFRLGTTPVRIEAH